MPTSTKKRILNILFLLFPISTSIAYPSIYLENQIGDQNPWFAELMYSLFSNEKKYGYFDIQGAYSFTKTNYNLQAGFLGRHLYHSKLAYGGYLYAAYNHSPMGQLFATLNPGIELLTPTWHINLNAYAPLNSTHQSSSSFKFASAFGISNYIYFQNHNEFDQMLQPSSVTGAGGDLSATLHVKKINNIGFSLGSYYFHIPAPPLGVQSDVLGITTGISSPNLYNFSVKLAYNYDPLVHNIVTLSVRFGLNHERTNKHSGWMSQPVQHNIATLGQANSIPIVHGLVPIGSPTLARDNIWFFNPGYSMPFTDSTIRLNDCTYEHPCTNLNDNTTFSIAELNQTNHFLDNPSLYLAPGNYTVSNQVLTLHGNESLVGRSQNYLTPAYGNERPILTTRQLIIQGINNNQYNTVANLQLQNTPHVRLFKQCLIVQIAVLGVH